MVPSGAGRSRSAGGWMCSSFGGAREAAQMAEPTGWRRWVGKAVGSAAGGRDVHGDGRRVERSRGSDWGPRSPRVCAGLGCAS